MPQERKHQTESRTNMTARRGERGVDQLEMQEEERTKAPKTIPFKRKAMY